MNLILSAGLVACLALPATAQSTPTPSSPPPAAAPPMRKEVAPPANAAPQSKPASEPIPTSSLLNDVRPEPLRDAAGRPRPDHMLQQSSLFAVSPPEPRTFRVHDLLQIVVRENSKASSSQELDAKKDYKLDIKVPDWPDFRLEDLLNFQIMAGSTAADPKLKVESKKDFKGEGNYEREDDMTARITAEVMEVLPNGNLIVEAHSLIRTDKEEASLKVTGMCRPEDVTAANTVQSSQLHDLKIEKMHKGELREASKKGLIAKILDTVFAF